LRKTAPIKQDEVGVSVEMGVEVVEMKTESTYRSGGGGGDNNQEGGLGAEEDHQIDDIMNSHMERNE
jgi:hypothetical protein